MGSTLRYAAVRCFLGGPQEMLAQNGKPGKLNVVGSDAGMHEAHANPFYRSLCHEVSAREETIQVLRACLAEKEQLVRALRRRQERLAAQMTELSLPVGGQQNFMSVMAELQHLRGDIAELHSSIAWKLCLFLSRCRKILAPPSSRRYRLICLAKRAFQVRRAAGFRELLSRTLHKFQRMPRGG
jgi:hypothetical protein